MNSADLSEIISQTINTLIQNLFSSIDNNIYSYLDKLIFINFNNISENKLGKILGESSSNGLLIIANALILGFLLFYCIKLFTSRISSSPVEKPLQFIFKLLCIGIVMNSAFFICSQIININNFISTGICQIGEDILGKEISFKSLISNLNNIISFSNTSFNIFTLEGILKSFCSIGLLSLLFSYSFRFILIKVFILLSPFAILSLCLTSSKWFFNSWVRSFFSLLLLQNLVSLILIVILSLNFNANLLSKFIYVGGIYVLSKSNNIIRELFGGISTEISSNFGSLKSILKK